MDHRTSEDRTTTDRSLRAEREQADLDFSQTQLALNEALDFILVQTRERADALLENARKLASRTASLPVQTNLADRPLHEQREREDEQMSAARRERARPRTEERRRTDDSLSREREHAARTLAVRDQLMATVGHELRNMVGAIAGFSEALERVARADHLDRVLVPAESIGRAAIRTNRLLGDLIDVARTDDGVLRVVAELADASQIAGEAVSTLLPHATSHRIALALNIAGPIPRFAFDPGRILQVLINLLSNALKFTPSGGEVELRVERRGAEVCFAVRDTGPGIPAEMLEAVFERYLQLSNDTRGVGLGLYISRCIARGHAGELWAESSNGQGTTMYMTLPTQ